MNNRITHVTPLTNFQNGEGSGANPDYLNQLREIETEEWYVASAKQAALDTTRNAQRSVAAVLSEYRARGYGGFVARLQDGALVITGWDCEGDDAWIPEAIRAAGGM